MRSRFSKHPSQFVDHTRRRRERTFRSATAFSRRPLGADISHLQDIAVLAEKVRSRSDKTWVWTGNCVNCRIIGRSYPNSAET